ncbi:MAG: glycosyltransferase family 39 protein, partial [Candidatus Amesbacteria bacterium]|nr:glycosyltransferase family 39 protein [Candidatus Amesbacteria bacterium]
MKSKTILILISILVTALFIRVYRISDILGFYYDQGRDASVIWEFWHNNRFFLIGPTTGIEGIFRGPWYYWLIAVPYFLGNGDPIWPAVFLSITSVVAVYFCFYLGNKIQGLKTGLLAALVSGLSYFILQSSRWLSNPTPMLLISTLIVYFMFAIQDGKRWAWVGLSFFLGLAMQFGSATEIFFFPAVAIFFIWQYKNRPSLIQL